MDATVLKHGMVIDMISSRTAAAESRPATPLVTGFRRPGGPRKSRSLASIEGGAGARLSTPAHGGGLPGPPQLRASYGAAALRPDGLGRPKALGAGGRSGCGGERDTQRLSVPVRTDEEGPWSPPHEAGMFTTPALVGSRKGDQSPVSPLSPVGSPMAAGGGLQRGLLASQLSAARTSPPLRASFLDASHWAASHPLGGIPTTAGFSGGVVALPAAVVSPPRRNVLPPIEGGEAASPPWAAPAEQDDAGEAALVEQAARVLDALQQRHNSGEAAAGDGAAVGVSGTSATASPAVLRLFTGLGALIASSSSGSSAPAKQRFIDMLDARRAERALQQEARKKREAEALEQFLALQAEMQRRRPPMARDALGGKRYHAPPLKRQQQQAAPPLAPNTPPEGAEALPPLGAPSTATATPPSSSEGGEPGGLLWSS